ncbi:hypothetical protein GCM10008967_05650 [Bacillus carboniphilus]|uniref:Uncharacterized protein n=1 Tax=Bacillus carboniphilus TaxID=86663 RepID=A0ABN0VUW1_9BACI
MHKNEQNSPEITEITERQSAKIKKSGVFAQLEDRLSVYFSLDWKNFKKIETNRNLIRLVGKEGGP